MDEVLILATDDGVAVCTRAGDDWTELRRGLGGRSVTSVIAREGVILAGTHDGVYRSDDGGKSWREARAGLSVRYVRWLAYHPEISDREFAGTEPAGLFVSHDGAGTWRGCPEVASLRDRFGWFLPYSPEAGCVRGFAFHGERAYAAVEVGGVLRSDDEGETWRLADGSTGVPAFDIPPVPEVHADVHSVLVHPSSPDRVLAATAEGLYISRDGGATWSVTHAGSYCRAAWIDQEDPDHIVLGPADSVRRMNGRIEETRDGGRTWNVASSGLSVPWPRSMVERFFQRDSELMAVTNDGNLLAASLPQLRWREAAPSIPGVRAVATLES